jgi:hypothetical protein
MSDDDHEHKDGCLCGVPHDEREKTDDCDLPAAVGGVEGDTKRRVQPRRKSDRNALSENE